MTHSNVSATVSCNLRSIRLLLSKLLDWYTLLSDGRCIGTGLASTSRGSLGALCTGINFQLPSYALLRYAAPIAAHIAGSIAKI